MSNNTPTNDSEINFLARLDAVDVDPHGDTLSSALASMDENGEPIASDTLNP